MVNYNKFKERSPEDTVFEIRRILHEAGLFPVVDWGAGACPSLSSNRVSLYPSRNMGQNGKGTDRLYASASGFAELMERLQNHWISPKLDDDELRGLGGFLDFPDEKKITIAELLDQGDPFLNDMFGQLGANNYWEKELLLSKVAKECHNLTDGSIIAAPYVDIFAERIVYLPFAFITLFGISNGMTAGNTPEEALVQGMSELYERHIHKTLMERHLTPPKIPRSDLARAGLMDLIEEIEASGRYAVTVLDCSLGEGYPVTAAVIANRENGTFGVRFGCHPSFSVSVERTLTEALQGRTMEVIAGSSNIGTPEEVGAYHNVPNNMKVGVGFYSPKLLAGEPSYAYEPWSAWQSKSNREYLRKLLAHAREHGLRTLVRDSSHLGWPSYHILMPGIHNIYPVSMMRLREFWSQLGAAKAMNHFPELSEVEEKRIFNFLHFKNSSVESSMGLPLMHDFIGTKMRDERLVAFLALKRGKFDLAEAYFCKLANLPGENQKYGKCYATLAKSLRCGLTLADAHALLYALYDEATARRVAEETENLEGVLRRVFPKMQCFHCEGCELNGTSCEFPAAREIRRKVKAAMAKSNVSQEKLLAYMKKFIGAWEGKESE